MSDQEQIKDSILQVGIWRFGEFVFRNGKQANNKFDMPKLLDFHNARRHFMRSLGELVISADPDVLWGVPSGGQTFAQMLGRWHNLPVIRLDKVVKDGPEKEFRYKTQDDEDLAKHFTVAVGIEDVTTELGSVCGALKLPELSTKTVKIVAGWRRGLPEEEQPISVPIEWVVEEHVPQMITQDHPFYQRYAHLAINEITHDYEKPF